MVNGSGMLGDAGTAQYCSLGNVWIAGIFLHVGPAKDSSTFYRHVGPSCDKSALRQGGARTSARSPTAFTFLRRRSYHKTDSSHPPLGTLRSLAAVPHLLEKSYVVKCVSDIRSFSMLYPIYFPMRGDRRKPRLCSVQCKVTLGQIHRRIECVRYNTA